MNQEVRDILHRMMMVIDHFAGPTALVARGQLQAIRNDIQKLPVDDTAPVARDEVAHLAERVADLETVVGQLHRSLSESPAPAAVQRAVADIEPPHTDAAQTA